MSIRRRKWQRSICDNRRRQPVECAAVNWISEYDRRAGRIPFSDKRTGPIVVIATGTISQGEARSLLSAVNYEADVTWNENTFQGKKNNLGNLLINVFLLCGILIVFAGVAGLAFGGIRIFFNHILPEQVLHREKDTDFISLNLSEGQEEAPDSKVSPSIKAV